jgi:branched-chain amino acid aminotransferase
MNAKRMDISANRMGMPSLPEGLFLQAIEELIKLDASWVPTDANSSLYIRPFMIATDEYVGIRESEHYKFIIFTCPVGAYYSAPVNVYVSEEYIRAFPGGVGFAKCAGNYAASLYPLRFAKQEGYDQILWLDGIEKKYFQECGTMNVFFMIDNVLVTPPLDEGTILAGITRDSVITLAKEMGIKVEERNISVEEFLQAHKENRIQDAFGAGTAATIAPIKIVGYRHTKYELPDIETRTVSTAIKAKMNQIKNGDDAQKSAWVMKIDASEHVPV